MTDQIFETDVPAPGIEPKRVSRKGSTKPAKVATPKAATPAKASGTAALDKAQAKLAKAQEAADKRNAANAEKTRLAAEKAEAKAKAIAEKEAAAALKAAKIPAEKPAPKLFNGFEVKADADSDMIAREVDAAKVALSAINAKEADALLSYLVIGEVLSKVAPQFKSTKVYGQFITANLPEMLKLDSATRSNSKWLYENQTDVLRKLGVNNLTDRSGNPTVLRQMYRQAEKDEAAGAVGKTAAEIEAEEKAAKKAANAELDAIIAQGKLKAIEWIAAATDKKKAIAAAEQIIHAILADFDKKAVAEYFVSMQFATKNAAE